MLMREALLQSVYSRRSKKLKMTTTELFVTLLQRCLNGLIASEDICLLKLQIFSKSIPKKLSSMRNFRKLIRRSKTTNKRCANGKMPKTLNLSSLKIPGPPTELRKNLLQLNLLRSNRHIGRQKILLPALKTVMLIG